MAGTGQSRRLRAVPWLAAGLPSWLQIVLGIVLVGAGTFLLTRPLTALAVLGWYVGISCLVSGVTDLLSPSAAGPARSTGWLWILGGLLILVWLGRDVDLLGPVVAVMLLVSGAGGLLALWRDRSSGGWLRAVTGVTELAFGLLALAWPDATLVVTAILFGGRTAIYGLSLLVRAVLGRRETRARTLSVLRWTGAVALLLVAVVALLVSHRFRAGVPVADAFYDAPSALSDKPGELLRSEPYDGDLPDGMKGYRLLYVTTDADGDPVAASAVLAVPTSTDTPAPLIAWAHGTVGVARGCAPSIGSDTLVNVGTPDAEMVARNGWAMVATDYPGMGTAGAYPYLIGEGQGRAVLDAARAARQLPGIELADPTVIWGHSQGGHAALWAGQLAATYAPDLEVVGTAALSPAADPAQLASTVLAHPDALGASLLVSYVVAAYTDYYPDLDLDDVVAPSARTLVREAAARCTSEGGTLVSVLAGLAISRDQPIVTTAALAGPFGDRLAQNVPSGPWQAPLFIGQGEADEVIPFSSTEKYVAGLRAAGQTVDLRGYPDRTHLSVLAPDSPLTADLEAWTKARFADPITAQPR